MTQTEIVPAPKLAFFGDTALRQKYVSRAETHRAADEIVRGLYWDGRRGCAVGCLAHTPDSPHDVLAEETNIPAQLFYLADSIFESLPSEPEEGWKDWPASFISAIPAGADLSQIWPQFAAWMMTDQEFGVEHTTDDPEVKELCREVARLYLAQETSGAQAEALADRLRAAWEAWAAWAAWAGYVKASADKLLMLLRTAPVIDNSTRSAA